MRIRLPENSPVNKQGYIILPDKFSCNGFTYCKVKRQTGKNGDVAIYQKFKENYENKQHFEVFRIINFPEYEIGGNVIKAHEGIPNDNSWGIDGFSALSLDAAEKRFNQLLNS